MEKPTIIFTTHSAFNPVIKHARLTVEVTEDTMFKGHRVSVLFRYLDATRTPIPQVRSVDDLPVGDKVASSSHYSGAAGDPFALYETCLRRFIKRQQLVIEESVREELDRFFREATKEVGTQHVEESA